MNTKQFRVLLAGTAYTLLNAIRLICFLKTKYAKATCLTIRINLLIVGVIVTRSIRAIKILFFSSYPYDIFFKTFLQN